MHGGELNRYTMIEEQRGGSFGGDEGMFKEMLFGLKGLGHVILPPQPCLISVCGLSISYRAV